MIEIFEYPKGLGVTKSKLSKLIQSSIKKKFKSENISIVFVSLKEIQKLNLEFREVDAPTDVLSFNYNTEDLLGEVYVCFEYIKSNRGEVNLLEEVIRLTVHGILHLYGYDHKTEFIDIDQPNLENIFVIQESLVTDILKKLK